jgi:hypothetical protein
MTSASRLFAGLLVLLAQHGHEPLDQPRSRASLVDPAAAVDQLALKPMISSM